MYRKSKKGFTVIETLVFSSILLLLMGCIVLVVQAGMKYTRKGTAYQDAQKQLLLSMKRITDDLGNGTPARMDPAPLVDSNYIIFPSAVPDDPSSPWLYLGNNLMYHAWVSFYEDTGTKELVRSRISITPSDSGGLPFPPFLSDMEAANERKTLARGVQLFSLNDGPSTNLISIKLSVSVATGTDKYTTVTSQTMAPVPNL